MHDTEKARQVLEEVWFAMNDMLPTDSIDNFDELFEKVRTTVLELGGFSVDDEDK